MWFQSILLLLACGAGVLLCGLAVRNAVLGSASQRWPEVRGRVLRSFVLVGEFEGSETYTPQVEYAYTVQGVTYRSSVLQHGRTGSPNRASAERVIAPYPLGVEVRVYVDPRRPSNAVLIRGTASTNIWIAAAGLAFFGAAALIWRRWN
ncbi:MAG TPA: DUF3592 domain-containing protein [Bryobacteraceae bacterium]|nr:DUF3592 domain-containing protein [Bryobacteraceae bacterium]